MKENYEKFKNRKTKNVFLINILAPKHVCSALKRIFETSNKCVNIHFFKCDKIFMCDTNFKCDITFIEVDINQLSTWNKINVFWNTGFISY